MVILAKLNTYRGNKPEGVDDEAATSPTSAKWLSRNHLKSHQFGELHFIIVAVLFR